MMIFLLVLIVLILLFGAAAVKGWIGSILVKGAIAALLIAILTWLSVRFGKENIEFAILVASIALLCAVLYLQSDIGNGKRPPRRTGPPTPVGVKMKAWKEEADRAAAEQAVIAAREDEQRLAKARAEQAAMIGNPVQLSKEEKKRRKAAYKGQRR